MLALTLWPEWAFAICHLGKRVENRTWAPGTQLRVGGRFAIHAGAYLGGRKGKPATHEALDAVYSMVPANLRGRAFPEEAIVACPTSAVVAVVSFVGVDRDMRSGWDVPGAVHWRLSDVFVLDEPVPCRGAQGLWQWTPDPMLQTEDW